MLKSFGAQKLAKLQLPHIPHIDITCKNKMANLYLEVVRSPLDWTCDFTKHTRFVVIGTLISTKNQLP